MKLNFSFSYLYSQVPLLLTLHLQQNLAFFLWHINYLPNPSCSKLNTPVILDFFFSLSSLWSLTDSLCFNCKKMYHFTLLNAHDQAFCCVLLYSLPLAYLSNFFSISILNVLSFPLPKTSPLLPLQTKRNHIWVVTLSSIKVFETNDEGKKLSESITCFRILHIWGEAKLQLIPHPVIFPPLNTVQFHIIPTSVIKCWALCRGDRLVFIIFYQSVI